MSAVRVQFELEDAAYVRAVIADELRLADDDGLDADDPARLALERIASSIGRAVERGEKKLGVSRRREESGYVEALIGWALDDPIYRS